MFRIFTFKHVIFFSVLGLRDTLSAVAIANTLINPFFQRKFHAQPPDLLKAIQSVTNAARGRELVSNVVAQFENTDVGTMREDLGWKPLISMHNMSMSTQLITGSITK